MAERLVPPQDIFEGIRSFPESGFSVHQRIKEGNYGIALIQEPIQEKADWHSRKTFTGKHPTRRGMFPVIGAHISWDFVEYSLQPIFENDHLEGVTISIEHPRNKVNIFDLHQNQGGKMEAQFRLQSPFETYHDIPTNFQNQKQVALHLAEEVKSIFVKWPNAIYLIKQYINEFGEDDFEDLGTIIDTSHEQGVLDEPHMAAHQDNKEEELFNPILDIYSQILLDGGMLEKDIQRAKIFLKTVGAHKTGYEGYLRLALRDKKPIEEDLITALVVAALKKINTQMERLESREDGKNLVVLFEEDGVKWGFIPYDEDNIQPFDIDTVVVEKALWGEKILVPEGKSYIFNAEGDERTVTNLKNDIPQYKVRFGKEIPTENIMHIGCDMSADYSKIPTEFYPLSFEFPTTHDIVSTIQ